tara:strand:+ start:7887 stop:8087 length:201 start_codon:yes stop_codon:yes gene_type:complete
MAKKIVEKDVKDIEVKKVSVVTKKQPKTKQYPLKKALKVSGVWKKAGETIKLTEYQYKDFRQKRIV